MIRIADNTEPKQGEFSWHLTEGGGRYLTILCPTPSACYKEIPVHETHPRKWTWDGNEDKPTLTPSIQCLIVGCKWHGYVKAGELTQA